MKRQYNAQAQGPKKKQHRQDQSEEHRHPAYGNQSPRSAQSQRPSNANYTSGKGQNFQENASMSEYQYLYDDPVSKLPTPTTTPGPIPAYTPFTVPRKGVPTLPSIRDDKLRSAPFTHRSVHHYYNRGPQVSSEITYEKLEFLGDAYLELFASRLIFDRYNHITSGQQSQLREQLVKNETLAEFSKLYGFKDRIQVDDWEGMTKSDKGNKGVNKILGDVFEAYLAAIVLSDPEDGFAIAEKWLTQLWAPKLLEVTKNDSAYAALTHSSTTDPKTIYNPAAKSELQKRIVDHQVTKLDYEAWKPMLELKGDQLGQNRHFIALYLTGYGYERTLLGKGEGKNKVEAGNWAAIEAMHGEAKGIVDECEEKLNTIKAERKKAAAARKGQAIEE